MCLLLLLILFVASKTIVREHLHTLTAMKKFRFSCLSKNSELEGKLDSVAGIFKYNPPFVLSKHILGKIILELIAHINLCAQYLSHSLLGGILSTGNSYLTEKAKKCCHDLLFHSFLDNVHGKFNIMS